MAEWRLSKSPRSVPAAFALVFIGATLKGQDASSLFSEVIDVRVVNLEVVVTDKDGARIAGLSPEDFSVSVDGQTVDVEYFTEVREGAAVERDDVSDPPSVPTVSPGGAVGTSFLVFVDEYLSLARDRDRTLDRLIAELTLLGRGDRMAVVAFDGKKLEMLADWTSSVTELARVLEGAKERPTFGLNREARLKMSREDGEVRALEKLYEARRVETELERVTLAATTALRSFARPSGRRAMLLLAGGWPYNPRDLVESDLDRPDLWSPLGYGPYLYRTLYDTANRLSYTLYPVDVRGFRPGPGSGIEHRSPAAAGQAMRLDSSRERSENALLSLLASQTGGRAMIDRQNENALALAIEDTRSYYWLGFSPSWREADRRRAVEVRTRDPNLRVRTRRSLSDLSRATEVTMLVESALLFGNPPGPHLLEVEVGAAERSGRGKVKVPIVLRIPLEALTFLPHSSGWFCDAELRVAVEDKDGYRNEIEAVPVKLGFASTPPREGIGTFKTSVQLRRKKHDAVVSIYDKSSGAIVWTRVEIDPR